MEPTACLHRILRQLDMGEYKEARDTASDLDEWIKKGGCQPDYNDLSEVDTQSLTWIVCNLSMNI